MTSLKESVFEAQTSSRRKRLLEVCLTEAGMTWCEETHAHPADFAVDALAELADWLALAEPRLTGEFLVCLATLLAHKEGGKSGHEGYASAKAQTRAAWEALVKEVRERGRTPA